MALLALAVAAPAPVAAQDGGYTKEQLQEIYMQFLKEEGYVPHVDEDGDVVFKAEGRTYFIGVNEKDPEFFRLVFPFFWEIESEAERTKAFSACNHANLETKVAKVFVVKDNTWASVELFVQSPEDFKPLFKRSLSAIKVSVDSFAEKMRE
ncbi:MAG: YbjN domain-containing protein [Planctomycetaceae bacterium]